jgi:hypothetical protein
MASKSLVRNVELDRLVQRVVAGALILLAASLLAVATALLS